MHTRYREAPPFTTKDGSTIRELMHPAAHGNRHQSLAEARVPEGKATVLHYHRLSEELYHITAGRGLMRLGDQEFEVGPGDTVAIAPGTPHGIRALGGELVLLCCCSPPYSHEDTVLLE